MQQGGSQYGVSPEMPQAPPPSYGGPTSLPEAASPISSRPPAAGRGNFDELGPPTGGGGGGFPEEDVGEEVERGVAGNRWPRQETLALLKIRSEMDAVFRDATLKGPLWQEVSRKLAELGYSRSAKKCKEKFENVHKYYKRTKDGRAGRQDGKSYKFFSQLEALHSSSTTNTSAPTAAAPVASVPPVSSLPPPVVACPPKTPPPPVPVSAGIGGSNTMVGSSGRIQPLSPPVTATPPPAPAPVAAQINVSRIGPDLAPGSTATGAAAACGISFSSNSSYSSSSGSEDEIEEGPTEYKRKRKRSGSGGSGGGASGRKMMAFFERVMKDVIERQEAMQQRFLEAIEKREQDRMIREEAWRRQEMARLTREHEMIVQDRAMAASRDAAVMAFLQKMTGQTIQIAQPVLVPVAPSPQATAVLQTIPPLQPQPPQPQQQHHHHHVPLPQQQQPQHQHHQSTEIVRHQRTSTEIVDVQLDQQETAVIFETASSSRWPKSEVIALIKLRTGLESRYQEAGPKGPLWEEISAGMQRLGFNRSSKRCKEKWENINKYFKKVKESNKKRPEDAKTCPYFHLLDALYRRKLFASSSSGSKQEQEHSQNPNPQERNDILAIMPPPQPPPQPHPEVEIKSTTTTNINKNGGNAGGGGSLQVQTSNGGLPPSFFEEPLKKPEDIVKELMEQQQQQQSVMDDYDKLEEPDSDNLDQEEDDDDEDDDDEEEEEEEEDSKMAYKIQLQRPNAGPPNGGANAAAGSFLAMVQKLSSS